MGIDGKMELLKTATVRITPEILSLIAEIDEFKGAWRAIGRIAPERLSSLRRVATIESVGSSTRIEGARLTDREVEKLLANIRLGSFTTRDEQEVAGYAEVMETIFSAYEAISFTENHIRQLHRDLLAHSTKDERHRGAYKTVSNNVEAFDEQGESLGIVFETASPFDTPRRMEDLIAWLDEQGREKLLHPLLVIAIFVVVFLEIHPFQDGNGRLSRILTTLLLLRAGYAYVPYSSLESIIEQSKESYYISLRRTQGTIRSAEPDWNPWIEFFLRALHQQKIRLEKKMERERIILADMPELSVALLELAREHGRITVAEAARITHASRHTIKDHLKALVDQGHLVLRGGGRGAWYGLA
ncbi:Fic family protein [Agrobacterium fabrum]|uniref:Fic family protein n=2 Tax=Agrobacterium fabrum TaxID=1176649 RepID=UPI00088502FC|nr:Fic family protein [Agrobacterium fabrum]CUX52719.1 Filamentation induced by cAMP protein Fic [Agrobacterium fabrum str. J-07]NTB10829.1 Fic family protein [Agrobacterium fabrum]WIE30720.1 Fic family protein [Agrobacterium fabrum]WIE46667.1 Fic family protein [Agrobacterium fabrum]WLP57503.1 Fic family protein [Agrobacterium fabrum]